MPSYFFHIIFDLDTFPSSLIRSAWHGTGNSSDVPTTAQTPQVSAEGVSPRVSGYDGSNSSSKISTRAGDWRYDKISMQNINMQARAPEQDETTAPDEVDGNHGTNGIGLGRSGLATKGIYEALSSHEEELGWGVVRLYRDSEETPGLYDKPEPQKSSKHGRHTAKKSEDTARPFRDEDCTTLCILAVPSYLTPSDFLGFVGEKTRDDVSHFRMIRTERGNRYMVLMKFRDGKKAREWRREWNGKPFDGMEVCHQSYSCVCQS